MTSRFFPAVTVAVLATTAVHVHADETAARSIGAAEIRLGIPSGTQIGADHRTVFNIPGERYNAGSVMGEKDENNYRRVIVEELVYADYNTTKETSDLFLEDKQETSDFLIGATITSIKFNTYSRDYNRGGDFAKSKVNVKWDLLNRESNKVIYTKETTGEATLPGYTTAVIYEAFRESMKDYLEGPGFNAALNQASKVSK